MAQRELPREVERAAVELVVADDHGVDAGVREGAGLGLAPLKRIEDRRALEAVARVEVQESVGVTALALDEVVHARGAAEGRALGAQAERQVGLVHLLVVGEQPRVPVGGVQEREAHVAAEVVGLAGRVGAPEREGEGEQAQGGRARRAAARRGAGAGRVGETGAGARRPRAGGGAPHVAHPGFYPCWVARATSPRGSGVDGAVTRA
ncbi:MAG: hypothetical protein R3A52_03675 [Polyangiales bacterium]